jgi:hypothetical protein
MRLEEGRRGRRQARVIGQGDVGGIPARARTYAVCVLEGGEEFMPQEGIAISTECIPLPPVELVDGVMKA